jgi:hypothetical protein
MNYQPSKNVKQGQLIKDLKKISTMVKIIYNMLKLLEFYVGLVILKSGNVIIHSLQSPKFFTSRWRLDNYLYSLYLKTIGDELWNRYLSPESRFHVVLKYHPKLLCIFQGHRAMLFLDMLVLLWKLPLPYLQRPSYFQEYNHYIHQQCRVRILTKLITVKFVSCLIAFEFKTSHNGRFSPVTQLYLQSIYVSS